MSRGNDLPLDVASRSGGTFASWSPSAIRAARRAVLAGSCDVVHVHTGIATPLAYLVASAVSHHGVPTVVALHSMLGGLRPWFGR
ncbi:glycosyltransferase [Glycomyces tarimensis]